MIEDGLKEWNRSVRNPVIPPTPTPIHDAPPPPPPPPPHAAPPAPLNSSQPNPHRADNNLTPSAAPTSVQPSGASSGDDDDVDRSFEEWDAAIAMVDLASIQLAALQVSDSVLTNSDPTLAATTGNASSSVSANTNTSEVLPTDVVSPSSSTNAPVLNYVRDIGRITGAIFKRTPSGTSVRYEFPSKLGPTADTYFVNHGYQQEAVLTIDRIYEEAAIQSIPYDFFVDTLSRKGMEIGVAHHLWMLASEYYES